MELSLDNLKVDPNHEHFQFNADHENLHLDPNILNSIDKILDTYEKKKILNLDDLDEEIKGFMKSIQNEMDQKVAEIASREESRRREENMPVRRSGVFRGIQGYSGYTGCYGITGTMGMGVTGYRGYTGTMGVTGYGITGIQSEEQPFVRRGRSDYVERTLARIPYRF